MDTLKMLFGASVIILAPLGVVVDIIRSRMFDKIDPEWKYHKVTLRGHSHFNPYIEDVPEIMKKIDKYTRILILAIFVIICFFGAIYAVSRVV
jgi:hypothetical protein